jgi:hypothetical protein
VCRRGHFFAVAEAMRHILVEQARRRAGANGAANGGGSTCRPPTTVSQVRICIRSVNTMS